MKTLLLISLLALTSCSSYVAVRQSTCEKVAGDIYKCEEAK